MLLKVTMMWSFEGDFKKKHFKILLLLYFGNITSDEYNKSHIKLKKRYTHLKCFSCNHSPVIHLFVLHVIFLNCHMIVVLDIYVIAPPTYNWYFSKI